MADLFHPNMTGDELEPMAIACDSLADQYPAILPFQ